MGAIVWRECASAIPHTGVNTGGYRGEQGRQHQSNENQKYGAINTGESIRSPPLPLDSLAELQKTPRNLNLV